MCRQLGHRFDFFDCSGIRSGLRSLCQDDCQLPRHSMDRAADLERNGDTQLFVHLCSNDATSSTVSRCVKNSTSTSPLSAAALPTSTLLL